MKAIGASRISVSFLGLLILIHLQITTGWILIQSTPSHGTLSNRKRNWSVRTAPLFDTTRRDAARDIAIKTPLEIISAPLQIEFTNTTDLEMASVSALGLAFSVGVIYLLASSSPTEGNIELQSRALETVYANVVDAALPRDATDVLTVVLGESIGGFIGAASTTVVTSVLRLKMEVNQKAMLVEAVADGDYFLARAAVLPLLTALGVPEVLASIASVLLATIPYELVKLGPKRRKMLQEADDLIMEQLLLEQKRNKRSWKGKVTNKYPSKANVNVLPVKSENLIDIPDIFADIIKWLEYDVLKTDFGGTFVDPSGAAMSSGVEGAVFGFLAGLSSQLYLDTVRTYTDYGPEEKRIEARTRTLTGWASLYTTTCLSTAALFGVYETCKKPISVYVAGVLSGGIDGCLGSSNVKACLAAFIQNNPPEATLGAQVRSLVTVLVSLWDRLSVDGGFDAPQYVRAAAVQLYSLIQ
jgi:hypothetical protein